MVYNLISSPRADRDIELAVKWYANININLAKKFINELKAVKRYICESPEKIQIRYENKRIAFLKHFPYGVHFIFVNNTVIILAIFNTSENPEKWSS